ncbi:ATP-binding protein [Paenibacillus allorhizosphaerae]|nr:ATP-binding protein [Paenibacillus allorhizosphaerae]
MSKYKMVLVMALFLIAMIGIRIAWTVFHTTPPHPQAEKGILDLRNQGLPADRAINLNGQWEFFPSRFVLTAPDKATDPVFPSEDPLYVQVPGRWNGDAVKESESSLHYGTYRLRILTDSGSPQEYRIRMNSIKSASAVYVDGKLLAVSGRPAQEKEQHVPKTVPYSVTFTSERSEIELVILVSNHYGKLGITLPVYFGTPEAVAHRTLLSIDMQLLLCVVLFMHGVYAVILYLLGAANKVLLYFSLLVICTIISVLVDDDMLLWSILPFHYEWSVKILALSYIGIVASMPPLIRHLFSEHSPSRAYRWFAAFCGAYVLFVLAAPSEYTVPTLSKMLLIIELSSMVIITQMLRAALKRDKDVLFLLFAVASITLNIIWGIVKFNMTLDLMYYPFDLMVAFFSFAAFWFNRFFQATDQTKQLADKLRMADKRKDDFLANTSHELRNPLHGIVNIAQSVLDDAVSPPNEKNKKSLETLITVGRRMSLMLDDLLDVTRLQDNAIRLQKRSLRVQSVAAGVLEMIRFMTNGKPIRLHLNIEDGFPSVIADENRLVQILFNLLHNAVKFTDEGQIAIRAEVRDGMANIHIADTGIGMNKDVQERIFQPYEQGEVAATRAGGGFGLGLSICKQLIELHDGTLQVRSTPGQGSVFTFTLPLSGDSGEPDAPVHDTALQGSDIQTAYITASFPADEPGQELAIARSRPKLLAVDDDTVNLNVLRGILGEAHYDITTAANGPEAIAKLEAGHYDLVIADVMMPRMSGYELTRVIRGRFSISELPVLLLTARSRSEDVHTGFHSGANDYVTKPVNAWELRSRVRALTDLKESVGERLRMEAAWLQAQIQPHFIFNTLNSIAALSTMDTVKMRRLLEVFGDYLRRSFDIHNSYRLVPIEHELALVRSYLFIEQERFEERLQVQWEIDPDIHFELPPLSIQPLVENAVRHGILKRSRGGTIRIRIMDHANSAEISICDDGIGMKEEKRNQILDKPLDTSHGIGLRNTDRRLKQLYGEGLEVHSAPDQGTTIVFRIPKQRMSGD